MSILQYSLSVVSAGVAILYVGYRISFSRVREQVYRGPNLLQKFDGIFSGYEGVRISEVERRALEDDAAEVFDDALVGVGLSSDNWRVQVVLDDLLGPVPQLISGEGQVLSVGEFERMLYSGELDLSRL